MRAGRSSLGLVCAASLFAASGVRAADAPLSVQAFQLLNRARDERNGRVRAELVERALRLCEQAAASDPKDPLPHLLEARAMVLGDPEHPEGCPRDACERAVSELRTAARLDVPGVEAERISSELGLVLSRLGRHEEALAAYDTALRRVETERFPMSVDQPASRGVLYGNSAETLMALGRLSDAIARYRLAEEASAPGSLEWQLSQWGLGVALDRDGQSEQARVRVARALDLDPTLERLESEDVFFEPPGDKFYYRALGHEVAGDVDDAVSDWRAFIEASPSSHYLGRARDHLKDLAKAPRLDVVEARRLRVRISEEFLGVSLRGSDVVHAALLSHEKGLLTCYSRSLREGEAAPTVPPAAPARGKKAVAKPRFDPQAAKVAMQLQLLVSGAGFVEMRPQMRANTNFIGLERCIELSAFTWRFPRAPLESNETLNLLIEFEVVD